MGQVNERDFFAALANRYEAHKEKGGTVFDFELNRSTFQESQRQKKRTESTPPKTPKPKR